MTCISVYHGEGVPRLAETSARGIYVQQVNINPAKVIPTMGFERSARRTMKARDGASFRSALDGRNRYRAATKADVKPIFKDWNNGNPWEFAWQANATRRHLAEGTKASCWVEMHAGSEKWGKAHEARADAANEKRSTAMIGKPYAGKGESRVSPDTQPSQNGARDQTKVNDK